MRTLAGEPLLSIQEEEVKPLLEPTLQPHLLPPNFEADVDKISRSDSLLLENLEENLQYLTPDVREMIQMAYSSGDNGLLEDLRAGLQVSNGGKLSSSNLRLLLLYDILSRDAKKQRLSDYYVSIYDFL